VRNLRPSCDYHHSGGFGFVYGQGSALVDETVDCEVAYLAEDGAERPDGQRVQDSGERDTDHDEHEVGDGST